MWFKLLVGEVPKMATAIPTKSAIRLVKLSKWGMNIE